MSMAAYPAAWEVPAAALLALLAAAALAWAAFARRRGPSPGAGAFSPFLPVPTTAPAFPDVHHRLEHVWRLATDASGRQTWHALPRATAAQRAAQDALAFSARRNPNAADKLCRAQMLAAAPPPPPQQQQQQQQPAAPAASAAAAGLQRGWDFFARLQQPSGHFAGDYGGPLFLTPCLVIACHVARAPLPPEHRSAMRTYLLNHQQSCGGWGLHIEGPAALFSSVLAYAALRCLGEAPEAPAAARARAFVAAHGGAAAAPFWAKFWLALLGAYEWEGVLPLPPELYLLPQWSPFHPGKMWCHSRMVFLPMAYAYGARIGAGQSRAPLAAALRRELGAPAGAAAARAAAWQCSALDLYTPPSALLRCAMAAAAAWERWAPRWLHARLRAAALARALAAMDAEDAHTGYLCLGPVSKALHLVCAAHGHGANSRALAAHVAALPDYLWVAEDGMKCQGYNGSQLWDTAFAAQALAAAPAAVARAQPALAAGCARFIEAAQVLEDVRAGARGRDHFRDASAGGWPFSTRRHGWPIVDCTAEALKAALLAAPAAAPRLPAPRLAAAARFLLALGPNTDGGWATYERQRGGAWFEWLNSSQVFADIMVDYTYTELTSAAVCALSAYAAVGAPGDAAGGSLAARAAAAAAQGVRYVRAQQRADGSWYGSWGVCFLYATWFGCCALASAAGQPAGEDAPRLAAAAAFVLRAQGADGGWGETFRSCVAREPGSGSGSGSGGALPPSNAVSTAWALLALMRARCADAAAVQRGVAFLLRLQEPSGDWPQGPCSGIFNRVCCITYTSYRNVFPLWALGVYESEYRGAAGAGAAAAAGAGGGEGRSGGRPARRGSAGRWS